MSELRGRETGNPLTKCGTERSGLDTPSRLLAPSTPLPLDLCLCLCLRLLLFSSSVSVIPDLAQCRLVLPCGFLSNKQ